MQFYVSNYHSKKALSLAIASGKEVKIHPIPLSKEQLRQNALAEAQGNSAPFLQHLPQPRTSYEISGSFNKQVPPFTALVLLNDHCNITKVE